MNTFAETETLLKTAIITYKNGGVMPHYLENGSILIKLNRSTKATISSYIRVCFPRLNSII